MKPLMKRINQHLVLVFVLLLFACSDKEESGLKGHLKLEVAISVVVHDVSHLKSADTNDFAVEIYSTDHVNVMSFAHASEIPDSIELAVGDYYAIAYSHNNLAAAFDNPYYFGQCENFTITAGQTTRKDIPCNLANIMVTIQYSSQIISSCSDYNTIVSNSSGSLRFNKGETRAGFFDEGPLQIESTLTYTGSTQSRTIQGTISDAEAGKYYEIHINNAGGSSTFNITLNEVVEKKIVTITGEETENPQEDPDENPSQTEPSPGDLWITEIMYNPDATGDATGEWIEIYNNSNRTINLKGLVIRRGGTTTFHQINSDVLLQTHKYAVLAITASATSNVNYVYGTKFSLLNTGMELILTTYGTTGINGTTIFSIKYGNISDPGHSIQLDASIVSTAAAEDMSNWCEASQTFSNGDFGTPGSENEDCY